MCKYTCVPWRPNYLFPNENGMKSQRKQKRMKSSSKLFAASMMIPIHALNRTQRSSRTWQLWMVCYWRASELSYQRRCDRKCNHLCTKDILALRNVNEEPEKWCTGLTWTRMCVTLLADAIFARRIAMHNNNNNHWSRTIDQTDRGQRLDVTSFTWRRSHTFSRSTTSHIIQRQCCWQVKQVKQVDKS